MMGEYTQAMIPSLLFSLEALFVEKVEVQMAITWTYHMEGRTPEGSARY
jgi:hypothetical protein